MAAAKKTTTTKGTSALTRATSALTTLLKEDHVVPLNESLLKESMPHIPSGSIIVDYAIGGKANKHGVAPCPGLPRGRITQLYGANGAGKTTLALAAAAAICKAGGTCAYIDWEHEVEPRYAATLGVPIQDASKFVLIQPDTLEQGMKAMVMYIREGVDLIVLDSVGAGVPEDLYNQAEDEEGKALRPGIVAAKWSQFLPKIKGVMAKSNSTLLAISQLRKTMASMNGGGPESAPQGGEAWKFYTSVRMSLRVFQKEKGKQFDQLSGKIEEKVVGTIVVLKLDKCKVSDSVNNEFKFYLRSGQGIDNARSVVELAIAHKIIQKSGAWFTWPNSPKGDLKLCGMDGFLKAINEDPKALPMLFAQVSPKLSAVPSAQAMAEAEEEIPAIDEDELFADVPKTKAEKEKKEDPSEVEGD